MYARNNPLRANTVPFLRLMGSSLRRSFVLMPFALASALAVSALITFVPINTRADTCTPPPSNMVSWWPGDGSANDIQGGNNGTLQGGATFTAGKVGQAFSFSSDGDGVVIPHTNNLNLQSPGFTADFWMKGIKNQSDPDFLATIFEKSHGWVDNTGWAFQVDTTNGAPRFAIGDGSGFPEIIGAVDVLDGNFHYIAGTWDGSTMWLYVDGVLQGTDSNSTPANNTRDLNIGFTWGGGTPRRFFRGIVDELEIFNRALSQTEIQTVYNAGSAGKCKPKPSYVAQVQQPINPDGSSVFTVRRGVVPVKFSLTQGGVATCALPPASIAVTRTAGGTTGEIDESVYSGSADTGSNFRIDSCRYIYNLSASGLGVGTYRVDIKIDNQVVGSAIFQLK